MWSAYLSQAAKARKEQRYGEAARLYRLASIEAASEGYKQIPIQLENCARDMEART
jgi:hypothetical protein